MSFSTTKVSPSAASLGLMNLLIYHSHLNPHLRTPRNPRHGIWIYPLYICL